MPLYRILGFDPSDAYHKSLHLVGCVVEMDATANGGKYSLGPPGTYCGPGYVTSHDWAKTTPPPEPQRLFFAAVYLEPVDGAV